MNNITKNDTSDFFFSGFLSIMYLNLYVPAAAAAPAPSAGEIPLEVSHGGRGGNDAEVRGQIWTQVQAPSWWRPW